MLGVVNLSYKKQSQIVIHLHANLFINIIVIVRGVLKDKFNIIDNGIRKIQQFTAHNSH